MPKSASRRSEAAPRGEFTEVLDHACVSCEEEIVFAEGELTPALFQVGGHNDRVLSSGKSAYLNQEESSLTLHHEQSGNPGGTAQAVRA